MSPSERLLPTQCDKCNPWAHECDIHTVEALGSTLLSYIIYRSNLRLSNHKLLKFLQKIWILFLAPTIGGSQLPVIPAPGYKCPLLASMDTCTHGHILAHRHILDIHNLISKINIGLSPFSWNFPWIILFQGYIACVKCMRERENMNYQNGKGKVLTRI